MTKPGRLALAGLAGAALLAAATGFTRFVAEAPAQAKTEPTAGARVEPPVPEPQRRAAPGYRVCLQPLGKHDQTLLEPVRRGIAHVYGFSVRTLAERPLPASAWYPPRGRYRAQKILDHMVTDVMPAEKQCDAVMGFTSADVSITKGEHADWGVLGLAYLGRRVGVVSSFRMRRDADWRLQAQRAVKVVVHELGHGIGVPHRNDGPSCIMNDAGGSVRSIDLAAGGLCDEERAAAEAALDAVLPVQKVPDWETILQP